MHENNKKWLIDVKKQYKRNFIQKNVLELGSGTTEKPFIRSLFEKCSYIGVDRVGKEGGNQGVDIVIDAQNTKFKKNQFDTLVCLSMFEHDPHWKKSLYHNLQWIKPGGFIVLCFGAEGNLHHGPEPWARIPYKEFLTFCTTLPIKVLDAFFEEQRYGHSDTPGVFNVIALKTIRPIANKKLAPITIPKQLFSLNMELTHIMKFVTTLSLPRFLKRVYNTFTH